MNESDSQRAVDESSSQQAERNFARRQQFAFGLLIVFIPVSVFFSVKMFQIALKITSFEMRLPLFALFSLMVFLSLLLIGVLLHRKWITGRFILTRAEMIAKQDAVWNKLGAGQAFPATGQVLCRFGYSVVTIFGVDSSTHLYFEEFW